MTTIAARALAAVPTPHTRILEILSERGPTHLSVLGAAMDMNVNALRPAVQDLIAQGQAIKFGWIVARASFWQRHDGFVVACIHCSGKPKYEPVPAMRDGPDAA